MCGLFTLNIACSIKFLLLFFKISVITPTLRQSLNQFLKPENNINHISDVDLGASIKVTVMKNNRRISLSDVCIRVLMRIIETKSTIWTVYGS